MKNYLPIILAFAAWISLVNQEAYSQKHIVNVGDFYFEPSNLTVEVGDTIRWVWIEGHHTTTSTTIPSGAQSWDSPITSAVTSFEYRVEVAGVYTYRCVPHSSVQTAQFTAVNPAPTLSVSPTNRDVTNVAGTTSFIIMTNGNWTATSAEDWLSFPANGTGNSTLNVQYDANMSVDSRIATITVSVSGVPNVQVTVTQQGAPAILMIDPLNHDVDYHSGSVTFAVTSNTNWVVAETESWISSNNDGTGNGSIIVDYMENTTNQPRVANLVVTAQNLTQTVSVSQGASTVSVNNKELSNFNVYPNPSTGVFNITTYSNKLQTGKTTIRVFDTKGNLVYDEVKTNFLSGKVDLSKMTRGTYLIQLENKDQIYTNRVALIE